MRSVQFSGAGSSHGRGDEAEVASLVIGADVPQAVAVVDVVFVLVLTRADDGELAFGLGGGQHPRLAGGVAGRLHHHVLAVAGAARAHIEALVVVLVDQHVGGIGRAAHVAVELVLALLLLVLDGVEESEIVGRPYHRAHALHGARQQLPGLQILDVQGILAEPGEVHRVGQPSAVIADVDGADGEEGVSLGQRVAVEDDLFFGILLGARERAALAAMDGVLQTLLGPRVVPVDARRDRERRHRSASRG